jgi:putative glycosyltransferase (TIGR04372 family)
MSGLDALTANGLRRPTVMVNYVPMSYIPAWRKNSLFIFKKLWLIQEQRFLAFSEIIQSEIGRFLKTEQYEKAGIELIDNTPEEITSVALEMAGRLKGSWQTTEDDEELQRRFWALFKPNDLNSVFRARIGTEFVRQNQDLL